jgi:Carboxypeptidase regulatory-like domain
MGLSTSRVGPCLLVCLLSFVTAAGVVAQEFRGAITGLVTDTSGGRLPGVAITATNVATNVASTTVTNTEGNYTIPYLIPGKYKVQAELAGFKKVVREDVEVRVADRLALDFSMELGAIEETVLKEQRRLTSAQRT